MLYINEDPKQKEKVFDFGTLAGICIGEEGRGRHEVFLPLPGTDSKLHQGLNEGYIIGTSKSGKPRISKSDSDDMYLILSSEARYTRRGDGRIYAPLNQHIELITYGNGADGDAGRIGNWDAVVLKAKEGDVFQVEWSGRGYGLKPDYYVVHDNKVYNAQLSELEELYESIGLEPKFKMTYKEGSMQIDEDQWMSVKDLSRKQQDREKQELEMIDTLQKKGYDLAGETNLDKIASALDKMTKNYRESDGYESFNDYMKGQLGYQAARDYREFLNIYEMDHPDYRKE